MFLATIAFLYLASTPASDLSSRLIDAKGQPVAGAKVVLLKIGDKGEVLAGETSSAADGSFSFSSDTIEAGELAAVVYVQANGKGLSYAALRGNPMPGEIEVREAVSAKVKLIGPDSKPAANIRVVPKLFFDSSDNTRPNYLSLPTGLSLAMAAITGPDGTCVVKGLPQGLSVRFDVDDDRFAPLPFQATTKLGANPITEMPPINLAIGATAVGRITKDGKGVPGIRVVAQDQRGVGWGESVSGQDGSYRLTRLASGTYNVLLYMKPGEGKDVAPALEGVVVAAGASLTGKDFLLKPGAVVQGVVKDEHGQPIKDVYVGIYGPSHPRSTGAVLSLKTDGEGRYIAYVPPGDQYVYVMSGPGGSNKTVTATVGTPVTANFTMTRPEQPIVLSGTVVDANGNGIPRARLRFFDASGKERYPDVQEATADRQGKFSVLVPHLPVRIRISEEERATVRAITVDKAEDLKLVLDGMGAEAIGTVADDKGQPLKGATVTLMEWSDGSGREAAKTTTDENGRYRFAGLFPDLEYSANAIAPNYGSKDVPRFKFSNNAAHLAKVSLLPATSFIAGKVVDEAGKPVPAASIEMVRPGYGDRSAQTDDKGMFRIEKLPKEEHSFVIRTQGAYLHTKVQGGVTDAVFVLKKPPVESKPAVIETGNLVGKPAPEFMVSDWVNSKPLTLKQLRGKVVVIDFWAIWCGPCRAAFPDIKKLVAKYKGKDVVVIGMHDSTTMAQGADPVCQERGIELCPRYRPHGGGSKGFWQDEQRLRNRGHSDAGGHRSEGRSGPTFIRSV